MTQRVHKKESPLHFIYRLFFITIGAGLAAVSIELFLVPNNIIDGGIIGVSLILNYLVSDSIPFLNFSTLLVLLNLPFMYSGYKQIGKTFVVSSLFAIVALAVIESLLHHMDPFVTEEILATVFGGLILGVGVGLVIRHGGSIFDGSYVCSEEAARTIRLF